MTSTMNQWTINDIKTACRNKGSHWFDPDTMRFFKGRVLDTVYYGDGGIFVSSEAREGNDRRYTVRKFNPDGADISTVGEFNVLSKYQAIQLAKKSAGINSD